MRSALDRLRAGAARRGPWVAVGLIVAGSLYQALCHTEAMADDAAIAFSYSRQLAETGELIHTASSERVEGFSNPTWTALCTLPFLLGMDPYIFSRTLGVLCLVATILLLYRAGERLFPRSLAARLAAPLLFGMAPGVCFWTMAGLENPLVALLVAATLDRAMREETEGARQWSGLLLAALALTRPEGVIYAAPVALYKGLHLLRRPGPERRARLWRHARNLLGLAVPLGAYLLWRRAYFAAWLPNTYDAKVTAPQLLSPEATAEPWGLRYVRAFFEMNDLWPLVAASPAAFLARRLQPEAALVLATAGVHLGYVLYVDGDWMGDFRFFAMVMPVYALLLGLAVQGAADLLGRAAGRVRPAAAAPVERLAAAALVLAFIATSLLPTLASYERAGWVNVELVRRQGRGLEQIARRSGLLFATAAVPDVGGSALYSNMNILDTVGLTDRVMARSKGRPDVVRRYVFEEARPDFYQAHSHWLRYYNLPLHFEFRRDYVLLPEAVGKRLLLLGQNSMRREHLTASPREVAHRAAVDLGHGLALRGYDDVIALPGQLLIELYVERPAPGEAAPAPGGAVEVAVRSGEVELDEEISIDLTVLPPVLLGGEGPGPRPGGPDLVRLRLQAKTAPAGWRADAIAVRGPGGETSPWLPVSTRVAGQARGADLARFVLYPRTHFACAFPPVPRRNAPSLTAVGRLQRFDGCRPLHDEGEVARLTAALRRRASAARRAGLVRTAISLLGQAELLEPESITIRREQRLAARAALREARAAADRGALEAARRLAVSALQADPLLSPARALYLELGDRGLAYHADPRERAEVALDRLRAGAPAPAALREALAATLAADRPLDGARALEEVGLPPRGDPELAGLAARVSLEVGLCERALAALGQALPERCGDRWVWYRAAVTCGEAAAEPPRCAEPAPRPAPGRTVFDFERGLAGWRVDGRLRAPAGLPVFYVSGSSGTGLLRTDWAAGGTFEALSPEFELDQAGLSLDVAGGGLDDGVSVELLAGGTTVRRAAGQGDHHLRRVTWDVTELVGQRVRLRVIDRGRGPRGHLLLDHVRTHPLHHFDAAISPP